MTNFILLTSDTFSFMPSEGPEKIGGHNTTTRSTEKGQDVDWEKKSGENDKRTEQT